MGQPVITPLVPPVVSQGSNYRFVADRPVTWSLAAGSLGTIDADGTYHAPAKISARNLAGGCQILPNSHIHNTRIDSLPVHPNSTTWLAALAPSSGLSISEDFPINTVSAVDAATPLSFAYTPANNGPYVFPAYPYWRFENGYYTWNFYSDRHSLAVNNNNCNVAEIYNFYPTGWNSACPTCNSQAGIQYDSGSFAIPANGATDAAGLQILPLMLKLDEILAGSVTHALRGTFCFNCINTAVSLWPSSNSTNAASAKLPYGARLRLRASYAPGVYSGSCDASCQAVVSTMIRQLKQYGFYNADVGSNWMLQAEQTTYPRAITNAFLEMRAQIHGSDFEVVDQSTLMTSTQSGEVNWSGYVTPEGAQVIAIDALGNKAYRAVSLRAVAVGVEQRWVTIQAGTSSYPLRAWVTGATDRSLSWSMSPTLGFLDPSTGMYTAPVTLSTKQVTTVTARSNADPTIFATISVTVLPAGAIRINTGDTADYTDSTGTKWYGDLKTGDPPIGIVTAEDSYDFGMDIWQNTSYPALFRFVTAGYDDKVYRMAVPNGNYDVTMYFGESAGTTAGSRWMNLEAQGQIIYQNFDIVQQAGTDRALTVHLPATVTDNNLTIAARWVGVPPATANSCCTGPLLQSGFPPSISAFTVIPAGVQPPSGAAVFIKSDITTGGGWKSAYGTEGYNVINDSSNYPSYVTVTTSGINPYTWAGSTTEVRALQKALVPNDRIAACWSSSGSFTIDLNFKDANSHQVAFYLMDHEAAGRIDKIDILDAGNNVLDTRTASGFGSGQYWVWSLSGHVVVRISNAGPVNAVISGIFFGPGQTSSSGAAAFVRTDTTTGGGWKSAYGAEGYNVINDSSNYPSYVTVTTSGINPYTWAGSTTEVRALQKALVPNDRIAACWSSSGSFTIDLNFKDANSHQVAFYLMDHEAAGRIDKIDILDAGNNVLDTRTASGFGSGQYWVWSLSGHVVVRISNAGPVNAVISGIFFGPGQTSSSGAAALVRTDTTTGGGWNSVYGAEGL